MRLAIAITLGALGLTACAATPDAVYVDLASDGSCTATVRYVGQADRLAPCSVLADVQREPLPPRVRLAE